MLPLAKRMRGNPTDAEALLWSILRAKRLGGFKFRRQVQIGRYIVDFGCFERRVIIEADGSQHAESSADQTRDAWLRNEGFEVLRYWNNEILENLEGVHRSILAHLNSSPPAGEDSVGCAHRALPQLGEGVKVQ